MPITLVVAAAAIIGIYYVDLRAASPEKAPGRITRDYVILLFAVYPLIISPVEKYYAIGNLKYYSWLAITCAWLIFLGICRIRLFQLKIPFHTKKQESSAVVTAAGLWIVFCIVSFLGSGDLAYSLIGPDGWYTGLFFQLLLFASLVGVSRHLAVDQKLYQIIILFSGIVFLIGYCQRFMLDPLHLYSDLLPEEYILFLSTLGQATWYSSFLCLILPVGIYGFLYAGERRIRVESTLFVLIAMGSLITQNSDSAFVALALILVVFFSFSLSSWQNLQRFGALLFCCGCSFAATGVLQRMLPVHEITLGELSLQFSQGGIPWCFLLSGAGLYGFCCHRMHGSRVQVGIHRAEHAEQTPKLYGKCGRCLAVLLLGILLAGGACVVIIAMNTAGMLSIDVPILTFDDRWGNHRGMFWRLAVKMYQELPLYQRILGIGPGMFYPHIQAYTGYVLMNAHNEWLNALIEYGIPGGIAYLAIFISAIVCFAKRAGNGKVQRLIPIIASTSAYIGHQFFCYQQCIAAPVVFVMIGYGIKLISSSDDAEA